MVKFFLFFLFFNFCIFSDALKINLIKKQIIKNKILKLRAFDKLKKIATKIVRFLGETFESSYKAIKTIAQLKIVSKVISDFIFYKKLFERLKSAYDSGSVLNLISDFEDALSFNYYSKINLHNILRNEELELSQLQKELNALEAKNKDLNKDDVKSFNIFKFQNDSLNLVLSYTNPFNLINNSVFNNYNFYSNLAIKSQLRFLELKNKFNNENIEIFELRELIFLMEQIIFGDFYCNTSFLNKSKVENIADFLGAVFTELKEKYSNFESDEFEYFVHKNFLNLDKIKLQKIRIKNKLFEIENFNYIVDSIKINLNKLKTVCDFSF